MREIGTVSKDDWSYPVLLDDEGFYRIDLGGSYGLSDPFEFDNDDKALDFFTKKLDEEDY